MPGEIFKRADGKFGFHVTASNGRVVATDGGQGYSTRADAKSTLESLLRGRYAADVVESSGVSTPVTSVDEMESLSAYDGEWVALLRGALIDHDPDPGVLFERLIANGAENDRFFQVSVAAHDRARSVR